MPANLAGTPARSLLCLELTLAAPPAIRRWAECAPSTDRSRRRSPGGVVDGEAEAVVVQREGAGPDRLDPARGPGQTAERVEVQPLEPAAGIVAAMARERRDQRIREGQARELEQVAGLRVSTRIELPTPHSRA